jgi:hypothetical protein
MTDPAPTAPDWQHDSATDEEQVRAENEADRASVQAWPEFELSWRTRRWMPAGTALWIGSVGLIYLAVQTAILFPPGLFLADSGPVLTLIFWDSCVALLVYGLILVVPSAHERESAAWSIYGTSDYIRLSKVQDRAEPVAAELNRADAGELVIDMTWVEGGERPLRLPPARTAARSSVEAGHWVLESAAGRSIDGTVELVLPGLTPPLGGWSRSERPQPQRLLISWWPLNARSSEALKRYEEAGFDYWSPAGIAPTYRALDASGQSER